MPALHVEGQHSNAQDWVVTYVLPSTRDFTSATFAFDRIVATQGTVPTTFSPNWTYRLVDATGRTSDAYTPAGLFNQAQAVSLPTSAFTLPSGFDLRYVAGIQMGLPAVPAQTHLTIFFDNIRLDCGAVTTSSSSTSSASTSSSSTSSSSTSSSTSSSSSAVTGVLTIQVSGLGTAAPTGTQTVALGQAFTVQLSATTGHSLTSLTLDNTPVSVGSDNAWHWIGDGKNHLLSANFGSDPGSMRQLTVTHDQVGGRSSLEGAYMVNSGSTYTISVYPDVGFAVSSVLINGVEQGASTSITVGPITIATDVKISFAPKTSATLQLVATGSGTLNANPVRTAFYQGDIVLVDIHPSDGYTVSDVLVNGVSQGPVPRIQVGPLAATQRVEAVFSPLPAASACPVQVRSEHAAPDVWGRPTIQLTGQNAGLPSAGWHWDYFVQLSPGDVLNIADWGSQSQNLVVAPLGGDLWRIRSTGQAGIAAAQTLQANFGMRYSDHLSWYKTAELSATPQYDAQFRNNNLIPLYANDGTLLCGRTPEIGAPTAAPQIVVQGMDPCQSGWIMPRIRLINNGSTPISNFQIRYYFTTENDLIPQMDGTDWYKYGSQVSLLTLGSNQYALVFDFTGTTLHPGESLPLGDGVQAGVHYTDWEAMNPANDFSHTDLQQCGVYTTTLDIPVFDQSGNLISGKQPPVTNTLGSVDDVTILTDPASVTVAEGSPAQFAVTVHATVNYQAQWLRNGVRVPGATQLTYNIPSAALSDNGSTYQLEITVNGTRKLSGIATLTVRQAGLLPVFDLQPQKVVYVREGDVLPAHFAAHAFDPMGGSITYQWEKNSTAISGATDATLDLTALTVAQNGMVVRVKATSATGSTYSNTATLVVLPFVDGSHRVSLAGKLVNAKSPLGLDGTAKMLVRVYNQRQGGDILYEERFPAVTIDQGRFTLQLGTGIAIAETATGIVPLDLKAVVAKQKTLYAEIIVGAAHEIAGPRITFTAVPYGTQEATP